MDNEDSPPDDDDDGGLSWLIREEELGDLLPAEWWDHLSRMTPGMAEQADVALRRITRRGRNRGEVLEALRWLWYEERSLTGSRPFLLARAKELQRLLDAARKTTIDVLRYDVGQLDNAVLTICRDAPDHLAALKKDADARRRDGEGPMNSAIVELLREVVRAAGGPRYRDVIILLRAVGVRSSDGALKQLARRAGLSRPRAKRPPKPPAPRGRPRNPNVIRNKGKRTITMGTGEEVHDAARRRRRGGQRDLGHDD